MLKVENKYFIHLAELSSFIFYLVLIQWNQRFLKFFLVLAMLFSWFWYPTLMMYGKPDVSFVAGLFYTDSLEASSYIKSIPISIYIQLSLLTLLTIILLLIKYRTFESGMYNRLLIVLLLIQPLVFFLNKSTKTSNEMGISSVSLIKIPIYVTELIRDVNFQQEQILKSSKLPNRWKILNKNSTKLYPYFVLVIGESVRKDLMHCYGFKVKNTPFISNSPHIQFQHFLAMGTHTMTSLSQTIVHSSNFPTFELSDNIVNLSKKAGYYTYWLSNQGFIGVYDSPISIIASASNYYYKSTGADYSKAKEDDALLPVFKKCIQNNTKKPQFIALHLLGSHPSPCDRTNGKFDQYYLSQDASCYVQSIKNTDALLRELYQTLLAKGKPFRLVYLSDHGLKLTNQHTFVHGKNEKQSFEVPFLIWGHDITQSNYISAYRNGRDFLPLFTQMNNISTKEFKNYFNVLSEYNNDSIAKIVLDVDNHPIQYNTLLNNPLPGY